MRAIANSIANSLLNPHDRTSIRQHHEAIRMVVSLKKHESAQAKTLKKGRVAALFIPQYEAPFLMLPEALLKR